MMMFKSIVTLALLMASFVTINANDANHGSLRGLIDSEEGRELVSDDQKKKPIHSDTRQRYQTK